MNFMDTFTGCKFTNALAPNKLTAAAAGTTSDIDLQGYRSVTFVVSAGQLSGMASGSYWIARMQHADVSVSGGAGTYADCASTDMIVYDSTTPGGSGLIFSFWSTQFASTCAAAGYRGTKRYVRLTLSNVSANPNSATFGVIAILCPEIFPASDPL